jgi:hypothetical protein
MAESPSHRFGQIIGELLEDVLRPRLEFFCTSQGLYLDYQKRKRPARKGKKVKWEDQYGNTHDLDFVIEHNGSDSKIGQPLAFIEAAWRRYTKHSRNKVQEIQGAILPLAERYEWNIPFLGAILAGVFTEGSLDQLKSLGFKVLYFPYDSLVKSFAKENLDIRFDESTPDDVFKKMATKLDTISKSTRNKIISNLLSQHESDVENFISDLKQALSRIITRITIIPLYGCKNEFYSIESAFEFLDGHSVYEGSGEFRKYEVYVEFSNGDKLQAFLENKIRVKEFLKFLVKR